MLNDATVRIVRTYALDLAIGDIVANADRELIGRVETVPVFSQGEVTFEFYDWATGETVEKTWPATRVVRIQIERRTS